MEALALGRHNSTHAKDLDIPPRFPRLRSMSFFGGRGNGSAYYVESFLSAIVCVTLQALEVSQMFYNGFLALAPVGVELASREFADVLLPVTPTLEHFRITSDSAVYAGGFGDVLNPVVERMRNLRSCHIQTFTTDRG